MADQFLSVQLPDFEGPLDLLLHVIRSHKLNILDIPIAFVTNQYLTYLDAMKELNLDIAGEYLELAATLAYIKSRMLLPTPPAEEEETADEEGDPREELVRRLLDYQRYKQAAETLRDQPQLGRDTFVAYHRPEFVTVDGESLAEIGLFELVDAFRQVLDRTKAGFFHEVTFERISVAERIGEIAELLQLNRLTPFVELLPKRPQRFDIVVTFLALLEMTKLRMTRIFQASQGGPIYITLSGSGAVAATDQAVAAPSPQPSEEKEPWPTTRTQPRHPLQPTTLGLLSRAWRRPAQRTRQRRRGRLLPKPTRPASGKRRLPRPS
jgi:segregation and condensation protein A